MISFDCKGLYDKRLGIFITQWKDSRVLQTVNTVMDKEATTIQRRTGAIKIDVTVSNDIRMYQWI